MSNENTEYYIMNAVKRSQRVISQFRNRVPFKGNNIQPNTVPLDASYWHWFTLRKLCSQRGEHLTSSRVKVDVNEALCAPLTSPLDVHWTILSEVDLSFVLQRLSNDVQTILERCLSTLQSSLEDLSLSKGEIEAIRLFIDYAKQVIYDDVLKLLVTIKANQESLSDCIKNSVRGSMNELYEIGEGITGQATELRLRKALADGLQKKITDGRMFENATEVVQRELSDMVHGLQSALQKTHGTTFQRLHSKLLEMGVASNQSNQGEWNYTQNRALKSIKKKLYEVILKVEKAMHPERLKPARKQSKLGHEDAFEDASDSDSDHDLEVSDSSGGDSGLD